MNFFLAIDGGGSGSRALVADGAGQVLARAESGPANIATDRSGASAVILALAAQVMQMAGVTRLCAAGLGLAGANASDRGPLIAGLAADRVRLETDAVAATLGALGDRDGLVAAIGTGAVYIRREGRAIRQTGGHGLILGDEGSGGWLGREALSAALRADDARLVLTPYLARLLAEFGGAAGIMRFAQGARPAGFAALAPGLIAAAADDPAAARILTHAEARVAAAIMALRQRSDLAVAFTGGLGRVYQDRLSGSLPIIEPIGTALDGALMLAREAAGAPLNCARDAGPLPAARQVH